MPITFQDIKEHYELYALRDISEMSTAEYKQALADGAFFWIDHHDFVRSTLSEEILATNLGQLDALIQYLQSLRGKMPSS
ncbi:hypothetical protein I9Y19_002294 [Citrobacter freundii]|uniref:Uncharacterized protein n=1 Tax=Citrobacter freundii TaxID=546 RepID=A0ABY7L5E4_CITFR|nr:hypothetical protein [Citrobacter freundii]EIJ9080954.1 hypothetical protein [Citrobacter freundii]EJH9546248.1 hypothetical protein [Citrobacter freundii]EJO6483654.1 hypothetical protein [Citrobacter freundii]EKW5684776.1 hypothetical protein [Citrobacter freundii]EKX9687929.1 hypothetical protein [Citrobacter freundii]